MRQVMIIVFGLGLLVLASAVLASGQTSNFIGAERCGKCHPQEFEAWKSTAHQRAQVALPQESKNDPRCIRCHAVGKDAQQGVQCESCHGPGKFYAKRFVMKDPELSRIVGLVDVGEKSCRSCHTESAPTILPFEWDRMWQSIAHGPEREKAE
jgi:nitrate/TMAO reductase-like tetraheme cytochrome c subunit